MVKGNENIKQTGWFLLTHALRVTLRWQKIINCSFHVRWIPSRFFTNLRKRKCFSGLSCCVHRKVREVLLLSSFLWTQRGRPVHHLVQRHLNQSDSCTHRVLRPGPPADGCVVSLPQPACCCLFNVIYWQAKAALCCFVSCLWDCSRQAAAFWYTTLSCYKTEIWIHYCG